MVKRSVAISQASSFFLFGARGTGKSTLIKSMPFLKSALFIDLLQPAVEDAYRLDPGLLEREASALPKNSWVVIDEIQKIPKLLNSVHHLIESRKLKFALTGSSARKLRRGAANLLAGRAFTYKLFPFSADELGKRFDLGEALAFGTLPQAITFKSRQDKARYLESYVLTYLREEIQVEQLVRNLDPFRLFLSIAAQMNGEIINYSNIARDTGVSYKTIESYFQILEDTLIGYFLPPYAKSVRKVQKQSPKFYFFDCGIKRALERKLSVALSPQTSDFGNAFETWFLNECHFRNEYLKADLNFSYLRTKDDVEVDLIVERPDRSEILVEVKSAEKIDERHVQSLLRFADDFPKAELLCVSRVSREQRIGRVRVLPWSSAFSALGLDL